MKREWTSHHQQLSSVIPSTLAPVTGICYFQFRFTPEELDMICVIMTPLLSGLMPHAWTPS